MDPALKFVVDVQNSEAITRLTADVNKQKDAIAALNTQLRNGAINESQFAAATQKLGDSGARATKEIRALEMAGYGAGRGLSQLSYAVDDIQYGFNAIVNNIPQIVMGLGGGAGIAGAIGIAAVAVNQLIKHWGELTDMLSSAFSGKPVAELEAIRIKAEEAAKAFEKLAETPTKGRAGEVSGIGGAITEAGVEGLVEQVAIAIGQDPRLAAKVAGGGGGGFAGPGAIPSPGKSDDQLAKEAAGLNYKRAQRLLGESQIVGPRGDAARQELAGMARRNPQNFPEGFAQDIENAGPEGQRRIEQGRLDRAGNLRGRKMQEAAEEKDRKLVDMLNEQGQDNQASGRKKVAEDLHRDRLQFLEDQRTQILERHHKEDLNLEQMKDAMGHGSQTFQGAKAVVDYYQKAAADAPLIALNKAMKSIQEDQRTELKAINAKLEKERRVMPG